MTRGRSGLWATARNARAEVVAKPRALAAQMTIMIINDFVWVVFWVLFFDTVGTLGGWDRDSIILLQAVLTAAGGLSLGLLANARRIGSMAVDGELDAVLALPVSPLPFVLLRRIEPVNLGDLAFGVMLFLLAGDPTPERALTFVLVVLASATLLTGFLVLTGAAAFFLGRSESGELGFHAMLLLGAYPVDVFAGAIRVMLFTVVPAAFISAVPAQLINDVDVGRAVALAGGAGAFAGVATATVTLGLRRYTSGSVWTRA
jgi:ABC-2 type transport system permease protein